MTAEKLWKQEKNLNCFKKNSKFHKKVSVSEKKFSVDTRSRYRNLVSVVH